MLWAEAAVPRPQLALPLGMGYAGGGGEPMDQDAIRRHIEEAARTGARELDLSNNQLTTLPETLSQLPQLQTLGLSRNRLTTLR